MEHKSEVDASTVVAQYVLWGKKGKSEIDGGCVLEEHVQEKGAQIAEVVLEDGPKQGRNQGMPPQLACLRRRSTLSAAGGSIRLQTCTDHELPSQEPDGGARRSVCSTASVLSDVGRLSVRSESSVLAPDGTLWDHYDLQPSGELVSMGTGSFGTIYRAQDKVSKADVAVKTMLQRRLKSVATFENELDIFKKLNHPSILRLFSHFRDDMHVHLVMELCDGGDLFERIEQRKVPAEMWPEYIWQMCAGMAYCHLNHIAHRDVKLENYMFENRSPTSSLKLIDFGLSCRFETGVPMTESVGTPGYAAPEVLINPVSYSEKIDIWSIGIVLYACFARKMPWKVPPNTGSEGMKKATLDQIIEYYPAVWKVKSREKELVIKLLKRRPHERPKARDVLKIPWLRKHVKGSQGCCTVA